VSSIKNTNQKVTSQYSKNFESIFGTQKDDVEKEDNTGTYVWDPVTQKTIKIDKNIPRSMLKKIEPLMKHGVRPMAPIHINKK